MLLLQFPLARYLFSVHGTCPVKLPSDVLDNAGDLGALTTPAACYPRRQSARYLLKLQASFESDLTQVLATIHHVVQLSGLDKLVVQALKRHALLTNVSERGHFGPNLGPKCPRSETFVSRACLLSV